MHADIGLTLPTVAPTTLFPCGIPAAQAARVYNWLKRGDVPVLRINRYVSPEIEDIARRAFEAHPKQDREYGGRRRQRDGFLHALWGEPVISEPDVAAWRCFAAAGRGSMLEYGDCRPLVRTIQLLHEIAGHCCDEGRHCGYVAPASSPEHSAYLVARVRGLVGQHGFDWETLAEGLGSYVASKS